MKRNKLLIILSTISVLGLINVSCNESKNDDVVAYNGSLTSNRVRVTFNFGEGYLKTKPEVHEVSFNVRKGLTYKLVKSHAPKSDSFECKYRKFKFWSLDGSTEIKDDIQFDANTTIYALYDSDKVTITFNGNGGTIKKEGKELTDNKDYVDYGTSWKSISNKYKATYSSGEVKKSFSYFSIDGAKIYDDYKFTKEVTLTANYDIDTVILTVDPNGGAFDEAGTEVTSKSTIINHHVNWQDIKSGYAIKKAPIGYTFKTFEYYDTKNNKWVEIGDNKYVIDYSQTIRAKYTPITFSITAKCSTGGKFSKDSSTTKTIKNVSYNSDFDDIKSELEVVADEGYFFTNFTNKNGDKIGSGYKFVNSTDEVITANFVSKGESVTLNINPGVGSVDNKKVTVVKDALWSSIKNTNLPTAPSGYKFDYYTYYNDEGKAIKVEDNFKFTSDVLFTAHYIVDEQATRNFATDSWLSIAKYADQGLASMKTTYNVSTFVGLERTVKIDNVDYKVKVIGENADFIDESGVNKATLTFEFKNVLPFYVSYSNYGTNNNTWEESNLRNFLNNSLFEKLPSDVKSNIVEVKKYTYDYKAEDAGTIKATDEKLFPLSAREMGYDGDYPDASPKAIKKEGLGTNHEDRYASYTQGGKTTDNGKKAIINGIESDDYVTYWTRSPDVKTSGHAWSISGAYKDSSLSKKEGGMLGEYIEGSSEYFDPLDVRTAPGVAPAFCIGKTTNKIDFVGKNYKISNDLPCYYDKTKFIKGEANVEVGNIVPNNGYTFENASIEVKWDNKVKTKNTDYSFTLDQNGVGTFKLLKNAEAYDITITIVPEEKA